MKEFEQIAVKINFKEDYKKSKKLFLKLGYKNDKKWNDLYIDKIGGVIKYNLGFESGMFSMHSSCMNFKTFKSIKEFKEYVKSKETKKGKLNIIVSKNYKELYEDNLALVNHILLDTVKNDKEWVEKVQKSNLNITLYTDKNDPELFKKSFDKFEVKLMDVEEKLTLENIQVDCSDLTTEQIEEMKRVVVDNGYKLWDEEYAFEVLEICNHFRYDGTFCIIDKKDDFKTITYDKFMELFDAKKEECNNNLKELVLVSHKGVDKSRLQEPEYVEQMIKEGKILHAENFNKSLVIDNGSIISNVKEGEVKSIEELHVEHREVFNPQSHYNNEFGSLYKMSEQLGLNTYEFDILKRVVRCRKKGQFEEDLQKTKDLIDLYLIESKQ